MQNYKWVVRADAGSLQRLPIGTQQRTIKFVFSSSVLEKDPSPHLFLLYIIKIINPSTEW